MERAQHHGRDRQLIPAIGALWLRSRGVGAVSAPRVAVFAWAVWLVLALPTLLLLALGASDSTPGDDFGLGGLGGLSFVVASLAFGTVGALIATRVRATRSAGCS